MLHYRFNGCNQNLNNIILATIKFSSLSYNVSAGLSTEMRAHFFLVTSSTCATYLWSYLRSARYPQPAAATGLDQRVYLLHFASCFYFFSFLSTLISDQKIRSHPFPPPETLQLKPGTRVEGVGSEGARATRGPAEPAAIPSGDACFSKSGRTPQSLFLPAPPRHQHFSRMTKVCSGAAHSPVGMALVKQVVQGRASGMEHRGPQATFM